MTIYDESQFIRNWVNILISSHVDNMNFNLKFTILEFLQYSTEMECFSVSWVIPIKTKLFDDSEFWMRKSKQISRN